MYAFGVFQECMHFEVSGMEACYVQWQCTCVIHSADGHILTLTPVVFFRAFVSDGLLPWTRLDADERDVPGSAQRLASDVSHMTRISYTICISLYMHWLVL